MTEPMDDAELAALRHIHKQEGLSLYPPGSTAFDRLFARLDAAESARDAALARAMPQPMPPGWSKVNHPDPEYVGYRIVGYRMPDMTADGRLGAQMDLVRLCPDLPIPTPTQES